MAGIRTTCKDNHGLGREGCGAAYSGRLVHCTLEAPWSTRPDGLCHETFSTYSNMDIHVARGVHVDPSTLADLHRDAHGAWRRSSDRPSPWATA